MSRLAKLILALGVPFITILILLLDVRSTETDPRQKAVEGYVRYRRTTLTQPLQIGQYVQARLPQNFRSDMSNTSFGNSTYYQTDRRYEDWHYAESTDVQVWTLTRTLTEALLGTPPIFPPTPKPSSAGYRSGRPMPYPPNDLWCVQLSSPDAAAPKVVLVALHQDMFNAEWIVHEATDPETVLTTVGCELSLP